MVGPTTRPHPHDIDGRGGDGRQRTGGRARRHLREEPRAILFAGAGKRRSAANTPSQPLSSEQPRASERCAMAGLGGAAVPGGAIRSAPPFAAANVTRVFLLLARTPSCPLPPPSTRCYCHAVGMTHRFVLPFPAPPHLVPQTSSSVSLAPSLHLLVGPRI